MRPQHNRPGSLRRTRGGIIYVITGVLIIILFIMVCICMFASAPIISEEAEIVASVARSAMRMQSEWVAPEAHETVPEVSDARVLLSLYRLRVFLVCAADGLEQLRATLISLAEADYSLFAFPIDIEVRLTTESMGNNNGIGGDDVATTQELQQGLVRQLLRNFAWRRGRFTVVRTQAASSLLTLWDPQSDWELGVFLDGGARVSKQWNHWLVKAMAAYITSDAQFLKLRHTVPDVLPVSVRMNRPQDQVAAYVRNPNCDHLMGFSLGAIPETVAKAVSTSTMVPLLAQKTTGAAMVFFSFQWEALQAWALPVNAPSPLRDTAALAEVTSRFMAKDRERFMLQAYLRSGVVLAVPASTQQSNTAAPVLMDLEALEKGNAVDLPNFPPRGTLKAFDAQLHETPITSVWP